VRYVSQTDLNENTFPKVFGLAACPRCDEPTETPNAVGVERSVIDRAIAAGRVTVRPSRPFNEFDGPTGWCDACADGRR